MELNQQDLELIRAFIKRDGQDFGNVGFSEEHLDAILAQIIEGFRTEPNCRHIGLDCFSNLGICLRTLTIATGLDGDNMPIISLCPCGNLTCWGQITFNDGNKFGKLGISPLY